MGLIENKIRIHIELTKDPRYVKEAVHEVITYLETKNYSQSDDQVGGKNKRVVRQVKRNTNDNTKANWKTGKLNGKLEIVVLKRATCRMDSFNKTLL
jgi:hypothetical protein